MAKTLIQNFLILWLTLGLLGTIGFAQDEPPLPSGLSENSQVEEEPALPLGLTPSEEEGTATEPILPEGLAEELELPEEEGITEMPPAPKLPFDLSGFWEARVGLRTQKDPYEKDMSLGETRLQVEVEKHWEVAAFKLTTDFLYDPVFNGHELHLEEGRGWLDLREANFALTPAPFIDLKIGRQILTWGTGDLLFINDLFPKDWNSFFIGRDEEYLKAPSDAVKVSFYNNLVNLDIIYSPRFDADRYIDGRRISYWNEMLGRRAGRDAVVWADKPNGWFDDHEVAWRFFKNLRGYELALYGYRGFWKSPGGMDPMSRIATFPELSAYGVSARGVVSKGVANIEIGYYDSEDDRSGTDPFVRNSEFRFLLGYEQEVAKDFTVAAQYYLEHMMDYHNYKSNLLPGARAADENRQVLTLRLTKLLMNQNLTLSLFMYYSPTDQDAYLRPRIHYKITDRWSIEMGGNGFIGKDEHTFFGQFEKNSNIYACVRYSFIVK